MFNLIRVELMDGVVCRMAPKALYLFLVHGRVMAFERSDGWVTVDRSRLRDINNDWINNQEQKGRHGTA